MAELTDWRLFPAVSAAENLKEDAAEVGGYVHFVRIEAEKGVKSNKKESERKKGGCGRWGRTGKKNNGNREEEVRRRKEVRNR